MTRQRRRGMTLIEVLVTLGIVGIMSTLVVLGLGVTDRGLDTESEANRLAESLRAAVDETLVTRRPMAMAWDETGYGFVGQNASGGWADQTSERLDVRHDLPRGVTLTSDAPALIVLGGDTQAVPVRMSMNAGERSWQVAFDGLSVTTQRAAS